MAADALVLHVPIGCSNYSKMDCDSHKCYIRIVYSMASNVAFNLTRMSLMNKDWTTPT